MDFIELMDNNVNIIIILRRITVSLLGCCHCKAQSKFFSHCPYMPLLEDYAAYDLPDASFIFLSLDP